MFLIIYFILNWLIMINLFVAVLVDNFTIALHKEEKVGRMAAVIWTSLAAQYWYRDMRPGGEEVGGGAYIHHFVRLLVHGVTLTVHDKNINFRSSRKTGWAENKPGAAYAVQCAICPGRLVSSIREIWHFFKDIGPIEDDDDDDPMWEDDEDDEFDFAEEKRCV